MEGDRVVIVGGGVGVSTVVAARQVGLTGIVITYEAGIEQVEILNEAIELNEVHEQVYVIHGIVGPAVNVYSSSSDAEVIDPSDLPECDVLQLDCEGAERVILTNLTIRPRTIIVEPHMNYKSPSEIVQQKLKDLGYDVREVTQGNNLELIGQLKLNKD